jgi:hypothetical protein
MVKALERTVITDEIYTLFEGYKQFSGLLFCDPSFFILFEKSVYLRKH